MTTTPAPSGSVRTILRRVALDLLDEQERITVEDVVQRAEQDYPADFRAAQERLAHAEAAAIVRALLRELANDEDDQLVLPGLDLPSAICVKPEHQPEPEDDESDEPRTTYYVASAAAVWHELMAGLDERDENVRRAQQKRDRYSATCERLRPAMEHDGTCTVREAWKTLGG